jgi:hypothetical protein
MCFMSIFSSSNFLYTLLLHVIGNGKYKIGSHANVGLWRS